MTDHAAAIVAAEAALARAEDELHRVQQADDHAYTSGAYDRAARVVHEARRTLAAAVAASERERAEAGAYDHEDHAA